MSARKKGVMVSCKTSEHYTPASHIELVHRVFEGPPDLDPGSNTKANRTVRAKTIYTARHKLGGYERPWFGRVWCNAPGDPSGRLVREYWKTATAHALNGGVVLWAGFSISQRTGLGTIVVDGKYLPGPAAWPNVDVIYGPDTTGSPTKGGGGRTKWIDGTTGKPGKQPQHGNVYVLLGGDKAMRDRFRREFSVFGKVVTPGRLPSKPRDLIAQALVLLGQGGTTKTLLAKALQCRQDTACKLIDGLVDDQLVERRSRTYHLIGGSDVERTVSVTGGPS